MISPPVIASLLGFAVAISDAPTLTNGLVWGTVYGFLISGFPMLVVAYLLKTGRVSDLHLHRKEERHLAYAITIGGALITTMLVVVLKGPSLLLALVLSNLLALTAMALVNIRWLISNHAATVMATATFVSFAYGPASGAALLPLVLITLWARLILNRHTVAQLIAGLVAGIVPVLIVASLGLID